MGKKSASIIHNVDVVKALDLERVGWVGRPRVYEHFKHTDLGTDPVEKELKHRQNDE